MRIAYVSTYDAHDVSNWSGLGYYIAETLKQCNFQLEYLGNLQESMSYFVKGKEFFYSRFTRKRYLRDREPSILKSYAKQVRAVLDQGCCDVVFSPGTIPVAYLETDKPIVFWTDATFAGMINLYPRFTNLCHESVRNGNKMEQSALSRSRLAIYCSQWAAETAIANYDVDPEKVKVVPFGANIESDRTIKDIREIVANRPSDLCRLLFCGVDWNRKGGNTAYETAKMLNEQGFQTELHIVGCNPPFEAPDFVKPHGFISKDTKEGQEKLNRLFSESHFLILPSRAECYGVVFAEASSFGLPSISTDVGGVPTAIKPGRNGEIFSVHATALEYGTYIWDTLSSIEKYRELCLTSFLEYESRLSWTASGNLVRQLIHQHCGSQGT